MRIIKKQVKKDKKVVIDNRDKPKKEVKKDSKKVVRRG